MTALHDRGGYPDAIVESVADFAATRIATQPFLCAQGHFPMDLWQDMGAAGLLGMGVPEEFGGRGLDYPGIVTAGRALARHGRCLGMTLSWLMHQVTARFFMGRFAPDGMKRLYLPAMADGTVTASIAISEPGVGGHPKHLKTTAEKVMSGYVLNGEKTYLTNGPIAGVFIVLAATGTDGNLKRYSAFVVPRDTEGLDVSGPMDVGFLRPCPHGSITVSGCLVREENLLGNPGTAYEDMALPFREVEDTVMMGPMIGAQEARLEETVSSMRKTPRSFTDDTAWLLGGISSSMGALEVMAAESARHLETRGVDRRLESLVLAFRVLYGEVHRQMADMEALAGVLPSPAYQALGNDLDYIVRFAGRVGRLKQIRLGKALVSQETAKDER